MNKIPGLMSRVLVVVLILSLFTKSSSSRISITGLHFINEYDIPYNLSFNNTTVGGLSGIDYDAANDQYFLISDDRSAIGPARFYTANIFITKKGIDSIHFKSVAKMLLPDGSDYPSIKQDPKNTPDPEAIRYDALAKQLVWTCEGERNASLQDPAITYMNLNGTHAESIPIPPNLSMFTPDKGPRRNGVLEGLTFTPDYRNMFVSIESPLLEDGPEPEVEANQAWVRLFKYDVARKKNIAQYAYHLDPVAYPANPATAFKVNGISDILALDENRLLVIERSFSTGRLPCTIKLFLADLHNAGNIIDVPSLIETPPQHPVSKKLLFNMDDLKIYIDNVEGVTFGPDLPNGHKSLIFVSDNNFLPIEKTQLLLFEVIP